MTNARYPKNSENDFLIDVFPRNQNNLEGWNKQMGEKVNLKFVFASIAFGSFHFNNATREFVSHIHNSVTKPVLSYILGQCVVCTQRCLDRGAAGSGRSDDNMESLKKRFDTYMNATMPIIEHYEALNLVQTIDATRSPEEVFEDVKPLFS
nr:UMP-CMP kinase 1-like [Cherax quadricarinatus]